jgi:hypothetical protein
LEPDIFPLKAHTKLGGREREREGERERERDRERERGREGGRPIASGLFFRLLSVSTVALACNIM